ncbi:MFS transporter [Pelobacter propionicus]|uniref:Major facilitator superfamily MFS_1 n=1 Tax=Pelobacter propionicus (strain DSM 2379 / NBRC 103807 / OttBd1) TaxID=338966 RepID=A1ANY9_PELPD|nr:MFS transporter [Pelobacter propionicus]ABK99059.1 major facilitator superfamily MFS_1 [Pelobacter propionicus DSM 2379]
MNDLSLSPSATGLGQIKSGSGTYHRANLAFFAAGFVTFVTLYDMQPLLPEFAREFRVSPALSSLPLSVATATLSIAMLFAGTLSETLGRKQVMTAALFLSSLLTMLTSVCHDFGALLGLRLLQGAVLAGLPAVAMAYLSEEMETSALGAAMGLYISGNAVGGMAGRLYTAAATDLWNWQSALASIGVFCLALSCFFVKSLPPSHLRKRPFEFRYLFSSLARHLGDPLLLCLYGIAFMVMGSFVTLFNYLTFRLLAPPHGLSQSQVSLVFLVYLLGSLSASLAGRMVNRFGRRAIIRVSLLAMAAGVLVTLAGSLLGIVSGVGIFTIGFFGVHSVASSWVGRRASTAKAQASALYLFFYYLGSSISGTAGGIFWLHWGWWGVVGLIVLLVLLAMILLVPLSRLQGRGGAGAEKCSPI